MFLAISQPALGQFKDEAPEKGSQFDRQSVQKLKVGVIIKAVGGPCKGIYATLPVPTDWPEQSVQILEEDVSPTVKRVGYRVLGGSVKQMIIEIPSLGSGQEAKALITYEITRRTMVPPANTSVYSIPKKPGKDLQIYLGPSPYIESRHQKISSLAKELTAKGEESEATTDWQTVEKLYDATREKVKYVNGELKGAIRALNDGTGDCEELTSLFIALCRASKVPARTVWVDGHCYPEFYLEDDDGHGHWFPCQAAGTRDFGGIPETRPILQKGDNFKDPDRPRERQRYVSEFLKGAGIKGGGQPKVKFVREIVN
jgi:hypothetical protein